MAGKRSSREGIIAHVERDPVDDIRIVTREDVDVQCPIVDFKVSSRESVVACFGGGEALVGVSYGECYGDCFGFRRRQQG